ncbi:MAG: hypothetical protein ACTSX9_08165 [Candidatus Njordarchaeales archaeon]
MEEEQNSPQEFLRFLKRMKRSRGKAVYNRVLAVFVNLYPKPLRASEIAKLTGLNYNSVNTVIHRLYRLGILRRVARGLYELKSKELAIKLLERRSEIISKMRRSQRSSRMVSSSSSGSRVSSGSSGVFVDSVVEMSGEMIATGVAVDSWVSWVRRFLDLDSQIFEHALIRFRVVRSISDKLRACYLSSVKDKDRAKQVSIRKRTFSLVISKHGSVRIYIKDPLSWVSELIDTLLRCGLERGEIMYFFQQLKDALPKAKGSVEVPVVNRGLEILRDIKVETRVGDKVLLTRIVGSHFPLELETSGNIDLVINFLAALAGVQHFSVLEFLQAQELSEINRKFGLLAKGFEDLAKALRESVSKTFATRVATDSAKEEEDIGYA